MVLRAVCLLLASLAVVQSEIFEFSPRNEQQSFLRRQHQKDIPIEDIHKDILQRTRRAAGNPTYSKSDLQDNNNYGLVHYSGGNSNTIIVLTYKLSSGGSVTTWNLYLSNDYGNSFTKINSRIGTGITLAARIFVSPENPKKIYFAKANSAIIYLSTDEGTTFTARTLTPNTIDASSLKIHPEVDDWVLARGSGNSLYVSRDFGETKFTKIGDNVYSPNDYQWGAAPYDQDRSIIYYNTDDPSDTSSEVHLYTQRYPYTDATKQEFDSSLGTHDAFLLQGRYIFAQKTINSKRTLWVSADRQPFSQAKIPTPYNHQQYLVANINALQALVIIRHNASYFNLYMSEDKGELYYLALSDLVVEQSGGGYAVDLEAIASMGYTTYIANQNVRSSSFDTTPSIRTLISFDVGANWEVVRPPLDIDSECILPDCSLHLHMSTSDYWRTGVYSQESAPGIIIAHGVTGQSLNDDNTNLFISRDGGTSWTMTLSGTWGVSVLDYGGLIVAARDYHNGADASRTLKYTCDEGITWSDLTFSLQNLYVFGVLSEPGEATTVVSLYGVQSNGWTVITVDFQPIFSTNCILSDFYNWTPFDLVTETGCLLGSRKVIQRRFPSHCCLTGVNFTRVISQSNCPCSSEDFECDYGYKHTNGISGVCIRDYDVSLPADECLSGAVSFTQSLGYHKIGGDVCSGGVEDLYQPYEAPCCQNSVAATSNVVFTSTVTRYITNPPVTSTVTSTSTKTSVSTSVKTSVKTSTVTVKSGASSSRPATPNASGLSSSSDSSLTMPIILAVILGICFLVIGVFIVVGIVIVIMKMKNGSSNCGYSNVPMSYTASTAPQSGGVSNVNFEDDDEQPLPL